VLDLQKLRELYEARPFKPFFIHLRDGRRIRIDEPIRVGWSDKSRIIMFAAGPDWGDWASFDQVIDLEPARKSVRRRRKAS
jgi:hypothetical protein